jgi:hypothetical protein
MLKEGDVIEIEDGHVIYANVPVHFLYENKKGVFISGHGVVNVGGELSYLAGKYIVVKTTMDGGGSGHGFNDSYPDGHHVFCKKVDDKIEIDFYQSGCFSAMIKDIEPIGKAKLTWAVEEDAK